MNNKKHNSLIEQVISVSSGISSAFIEHNLFLKKFLTRFLHNEQDIEDVVQEVYLRAVKAESNRKEQGKTIEQPKAFLFTIAKNLALNELNRKSRQITSYIEDCQADITHYVSPTIEAEHDAELALGEYCEAIAALPDKSRKIYLLRKVQGLPQKEIAKQLDISLSSVEKHLKIGILSCRAAKENSLPQRQYNKQA